jgi:recombination protein RecT
MSKQTEKLTTKLVGNPENPPPKTFAGIKSNEMQKLLEMYKGAIAQVIPKHLNTEKLIGLAVHTLSHNPGLANCTVQSVIGGVIQASIMGFELNTTLGHCYLIPRKGVAEFQLGYKGMNDLAYRHPKVQTVYTRAVYEGETLIHEEGLNPILEHKNIKGSGKLTHAYAIVTLTNGGKVFEVLNREQIEAIRMRSPASSSEYSPWSSKHQGDYDKMAMKTALRSLFNKGEMPYSIEMKYAALDEHKIELGDFLQDQSGDVDLAKLEEVQGIVVDDPKSEQKPEEKPKTEPKKAEEPIEPAKEEKQPNQQEQYDQALESEKQLKQSILRQIKDENRKTSAGKAKLAQILNDNKVDSLVRLGEILDTALLQSCLDVINLANEEATPKN